MGSLRASAVSGVKWTGASGLFVVGVHLLQTSMLAHLLPREDFGLMGMVLVVIGFAQAFADLGLSNAIIHRQDATADALSSLYWLNLLSGLALFGIVAVASPGIAVFYREPRLIDPVIWAALTFCIAPLGHPFQVLLQKELRFERLSRVEVGAAVAGAGVAVGSALAGLGVFALVWGGLAGAAVKAVLLAVTGWRTWHPRAHFCREDLKGYLGFGFYQMGERGVNFLSANMDYLIIGRFLGAEILGVYVLAYRLVIQPLSRLNPILTRVAFPIFAKRQTDDAALRRGYLEIARLLGFVAFPVLVGLGVTAPLFVPLFLGGGWGPTVLLVQILIPVGIWKSLGNPLGSVLLAKGRADIGFKLNLFTFAVNTLAFRGAVQYGVFAVAGAYAAVGAVAFGVGQVVLKSTIGLGFTPYLSALVRSLTMSVVMGILLYAAYLFLIEWSSDRLFLQIFLTLLGVFVYGSLAVAFESEFLKEVRGWVIRRGQGA